MFLRSAKQAICLHGAIVLAKRARIRGFCPKRSRGAGGHPIGYSGRWERDGGSNRGGLLAVLLRRHHHLRRLGGDWTGSGRARLRVIPQKRAVGSCSWSLTLPPSDLRHRRIGDRRSVLWPVMKSIRGRPLTTTAATATHNRELNRISTAPKRALPEHRHTDMRPLIPCTAHATTEEKAAAPSHLTLILVHMQSDWAPSNLTPSPSMQDKHRNQGNAMGKMRWGIINSPVLLRHAHFLEKKETWRGAHFGFSAARSTLIYI